MPESGKASTTVPVGSFFRWGVMLLLGGAVAFPYVNSRSSNNLPGASRPGAATSSPPVTNASTVDGDTRTDALTLLADFAGVDISEDRIVRDAQVEALNALREAGMPVTLDEVRSALFELQRAKRFQADLKELASIIDLRRPEARARPLSLTTAGGTTLPAVAHFLQTRTGEDALQALRLERVRKQIDSTSTKVEFIVATVPDPIDSNARWTFDPLVAAIQGAAADWEYVLDRFYIPDWDPARDPVARGPAGRRVHEKWPAVILFRHAHFGTDAGNDRRLLVTLLVAETPTSGVHRVAFNEAVSQVLRWQCDPQQVPASAAQIDQACRRPIRVIGPTFSGSAPSLALAIGDLRGRFPDIRFRVVTGSASNFANQAIIEAAGGGRPNTSFHATVLPDEFVHRTTIDFLLETDPHLLDGNRLALLVEGNTTYGEGLKVDSAHLPKERDASTKTPAPRPADLGTTGCRGMEVPSQCVLEHAIVLPFPLHISRLRSTAGAADRPQAAASNSGPRLALPLDDPGAATDQIPSLSPASTSSAVELELANILDTINREQITTVGLLATDTRDKLFLAEQIERRDTTVRLYTLESDLFYTHPDYSAYVRGMIVASTYPLFNQNQRRVSGTRKLLQFPTTNAEGTFNAMIAALSVNDQGELEHTRNLVDYGTPGGTERLPPVWISVVGRDAIWPLKWYPARGTAVGYLFGGVPSLVSGAGREMTASERRAPAGLNMSVSPSRTTVFGFFALLLLSLAHAAAYCLRGRVSAPFSQWPFLRFHAPQGMWRRTPYLFVALASLLVVYSYMAYLFARVGWHEFGQHVPSEALVLLGVGGCVLAVWMGLAYALAAVAWGVLPRIRTWVVKSLRSGPHFFVLVLMLVGLLCVGIAGAQGAVYLLRATRPQQTWVYYFDRVMHPANAVSPLMPLVFVGAAVYLWAVMHLRRLTAVEGGAIAESLSVFDKLGLAELRSSARELGNFIDASVQKLPIGVTAGVLAGVLVAAYLITAHPLTTPESRPFTVAFSAAWVLLQGLLLLGLAQALRFWTLLKRAMCSFDGTPMISAFVRLPARLFNDRLSPRPPDRIDLRRSIRLASQLGLALDNLDQKELGLDSEAYQRLRNGLTRAEPSADLSALERHKPWAETDEWIWLRSASAALAEPVKGFWATRPRESLLSTADFDADVTNIKTDAQRWFLRAEEFLAMQVLLVVRELLARLVNLCFYLVVGVLLFVAAQQSFPFQPHQELLGTAWVYVIGTVLLVLRIFIQMEHDPVLSAFASTNAGRIQWDRSVWSKVFLYAVIPIATVFAAQFPQIGNSILGWLAPVQHVLP